MRVEDEARHDAELPRLNGDAMPSTLECDPEGQDRVDVTGAPDRRQEHVQRPGLRQ